MIKLYREVLTVMITTGNIDFLVAMLRIGATSKRLYRIKQLNQAANRLALINGFIMQPAPQTFKHFVGHYDKEIITDVFMSKDPATIKQYVNSMGKWVSVELAKQLVQGRLSFLEKDTPFCYTVYKNSCNIALLYQLNPKEVVPLLDEDDSRKIISIPAFCDEMIISNKMMFIKLFSELSIERKKAIINNLYRDNIAVTNVLVEVLEEEDTLLFELARISVINVNDLTQITYNCKFHHYLLFHTRTTNLKHRAIRLIEKHGYDPDFAIPMKLFIK